MFKKITVSLLLATFLFFVTCAQNVSAFSEASFPSCDQSNSFDVIAHYDSGTHAIVGDQTLHTGSDTVYKITDQQVLQCFCPDSGTIGIQTNWLNASSFSQEEIDSYISNGWTKIDNGADWGLENTVYLARNSNYTCNCSTGTPIPTPTETPIMSTPSATIIPTETLIQQSIGQGGSSNSIGSSANSTGGTSSTPGVGGKIPNTTPIVLASTGTFQNDIMNVMSLAGFLLIGLSLVIYAQEKAKQ